MSNSILPSFPGLAFGITKRPIWYTNTADAVSGRQYTLRRRLYPLWQFRLPYEVLRANVAFSELQQIVTFFNSRNGKYDDFLYLDPRENAVTAQGMGTGDGVTTAFEFVRAWGGYTEPVGGTGSPVISLNGVAKTLGVDWNIDAKLRVATFVTPPAPGVAITWTGTYYYRARFINDYLPLEEFMQHKWKTDIEFRTFRA